jgi:hypothetical protein
MSDRIHWRCACANLLSAPASWRHRPVRCPACDATAPVPDASEPDAESETARREGPWLDRRTEPDGRSLDPSPYAGWVMRTEGGPPADDPFFHRFRVDAAALRKASRRKWWVLGLIVVTLLAVAGGVMLSRHLWKTRWSAAARMERAGFGERLTSVEVPAWRLAMREVRNAEKALEDAKDGLEAAEHLQEAYLVALKEAEAMPRGPRAHLYNNAAWFFVTTPHPDLRQPVRALDLAQSATEWTGRKDAGLLDTLAETLSVAGRTAEAAQAEDEALALEPGSTFYRERATKFRAVAGLPPPPPAPPAMPEPPDPDR